jgi:hypothetical protein
VLPVVYYGNGPAALPWPGRADSCPIVQTAWMGAAIAPRLGRMSTQTPFDLSGPVAATVRVVRQEALGCMRGMA